MSYIYGEEKPVTISENELRYLVRCRCELEALQSGGVDNWSWYSESIDNYVKDYFDLEENKPEDPCLEDVVDSVMKRYEEV